MRAPVLEPVGDTPSRAAVAVASTANELFEGWCSYEELRLGPHAIFRIAERPGGRAAVRTRLLETVRSHYDDPRNIADDIAELGYEGAAEVLRQQLPESARARSGDLGEIIATEFVEELTGYRVPVRRLRFKDGREMALRGEDLIAVRINNGLHYLKGEAKSRKTLPTAVVVDARKALNTHSGRPSSYSLNFIAKRLIESPEAGDRELGRLIRNGTARDSIPTNRVRHMIVVLSGNDCSNHVLDDITQYEGEIQQYGVCFTIHDHQDFIKWTYEEVIVFGND
jgi:hypothetical protein